MRRNRGVLLRAQRFVSGTIIHRIRQLAVEGSYELTGLAKRRIAEDGLEPGDVDWILKHGGKFWTERASVGLQYKVAGLLPDGRGVRVTVGLRDDFMNVITVLAYEY